jgi:CheY-like chemotaxis protein
MKKRILVVDDDKGITSMAKKCLEASGLYEVQEETLAEHCIEAAREFLPDLILLDWKMPVLNGAEVAAVLKKEPNLWNIPILFITGFGTRAGKLGYPVLEKPFSQKQLVEWAGRLLQDKESAGAPD